MLNKILIMWYRFQMRWHETFLINRLRKYKNENIKPPDKDVTWDYLRALKHAVNNILKVNPNDKEALEVMNRWSK